MIWGNSYSPKSPFIFPILNCNMYKTINARTIWNASLESAFIPFKSSITPTTSSVSAPEPKSKVLIDSPCKSTVKIAKVAMGMAAER